MKNLTTDSSHAPEGEYLIPEADYSAVLLDEANKVADEDELLIRETEEDDKLDDSESDDDDATAVLLDDELDSDGLSITVNEKAVLASEGTIGYAYG